MLPIKSKYKVAKRLGAAIFEKTQTQKFALAEGRVKGVRRGRREPSDYGRQLLEKQRVRYTYSLSEKQLSRYASAAIKAKSPSDALHHSLELRADSVAYHAGFAPTRRAARQMVSHGHLLRNGRRITVPSARLAVGDVLEVRPGSASKALFARLSDGSENEEDRRTPPAWLSIEDAHKATVKAEPRHEPGVGLDYTTVFEFYSR